MKIFDISPLISEKIAVWPGDTPFSRQELLSLKSGSNIDLSTIHTTVHLGAHVDARSHYVESGPGIDQADLLPYIGRAQVIEVQAPHRRILPSDVKVNITEPRVLFKTNSFRNPEHFNTDFSSLSKELIEFLASHKVLLVGIDTPSVDPYDDKVLESHHALRDNQMVNLEGIVLHHIDAGVYNLVALPLKIKDADASPVRAILYT